MSCGLRVTFFKRISEMQNCIRRSINVRRKLIIRSPRLTERAQQSFLCKLVEAAAFCVGVPNKATTITKLVYGIPEFERTGVEAGNQIT